MAEIAWMKVHGQEQYRDLSRRLKAAGRGDLQRKLTKTIRKEGDPALRKTQSAFRGVSMTSDGSGSGGGSTGLRARVADATRISILGTGIRIRVHPERVDPAYGRTLSWGVNGQYWRHPVYGNREIWRGQRGQRVFYESILPFEPRWRAGIERAMDETAAQIEG